MPPLVSPTTPHQSRREPSPHYFGLHVDPTTTTVRSTGASIAQTPWTPSNSHIFHNAVDSPQKIMANNPDYEAFLNQKGDKRPGSTRSQIRSHVLPPSPPSAANTQLTNMQSRNTTNPPINMHVPASLPLTKAESISNDEAAPHSRSPKRLLSTDSGILLGGPRRQSPADFNDTASARSMGSPQRRNDGQSMRLSLPTKNLIPSADSSHQRAETMPASLDSRSPTLIQPSQAIDIWENEEDKTLLLDLRVSTQYAQARIRGSLNLCIPTTLLKRTSYNASRLADTFTETHQKAKFSSWKSCNTIIVYDGNSSQLKEASSCVNILNKFDSEGWKGKSLIIRGGFLETEEECPDAIDDSASGGPRSQSANLAIRSEGTSLPPVMGGCPMPATDNAANPFFGNIRQNMDLIDGVGQIPVQCPPSLNDRDRRELPDWLHRASNDRDEGKSVSNLFLKIEKREQKRMHQALSGNASQPSPGTGPVQKVEIAGIEKGSKNRYNNIFPYEHSRVRLQGVSRESCDYVNANFLKTSMSHKKYIATQGPIPATFTDFWNMVWQRDIRVIVMLTAEFEGGQVKAHNYWKEKRYGQVLVNFHAEHKASLEGSRMQQPKDRADMMAKRRSSHMDHMKRVEPSTPSTNGSMGKEESPSVIVRKFTISHADHPFERMREVTHLQYAQWPDFGAPAHPAHLLGLVDQCDSVVRATGTGPRDEPEPPSDRPVLVHCSAGCGRTGTFCTVDTVIDILKRQRRRRLKPREPTPMEIDSPQPDRMRDGRRTPSQSHAGAMTGPKIPRKEDMEGEWLMKDDIDFIERTVEEFRVQRLSMVQSLRQFVLCYETVLEWIAQQGQPKTA